jgi:GTP-binding protein
VAKFNFENTKHAYTAGRLDQCPEDGKWEIVLAGKSNVGKSSLVNALTGQKKLARVSQSPGKTRLILYFEVDKAFYLTDLPGYGFAKASKSEIAQFNSLADDYLNADRPIALVLVLIDSRRGPEEADLALIDWLIHQGMPYLIVFSKADKLSKSQMNAQVFAWEKEGRLPDHVPYIAISSSKKIGLEELRIYISDFINKL